MSILASSGGSFQAATDMYVSQGGAWVQVPMGGGGCETFPAPSVEGHDPAEYMWRPFMLDRDVDLIYGLLQKSGVDNPGLQYGPHNTDQEWGYYHQPSLGTFDGNTILNGNFNMWGILDLPIRLDWHVRAFYNYTSEGDTIPTEITGNLYMREGFLQQELITDTPITIPVEDCQNTPLQYPTTDWTVISTVSTTYPSGSVMAWAVLFLPYVAEHPSIYLQVKKLVCYDFATGVPIPGVPPAADAQLPDVAKQHEELQQLLRLQEQAQQ